MPVAPGRRGRRGRAGKAGRPAGSLEGSDPTLPRSLEGRVAVVTGGAVRLGRAIVTALVGRGAHVVFTFRSHPKEAARLVRELRDALGTGGDRVSAEKCDVTREAEVKRLFRRVRERHGRIDLLVNNAAIFERTPLPAVSLAAWQRHLDVNLTGGFLCAREAAKLMLRGDGGVVVNIACAGGVRPWAAYLPYCVSKAGVIMMTQVLAKALAPAIRVNAVLPGPVLLPERYDAAARRRAVETTALKRLGSPADVARAVLFCWDSDYTTGALVPVEGGRLIV